MCVAGGITANFEPRKVMFVPSLFMVLFVPMVLRRHGEQPDLGIRKEFDV
jgi:hypothetical protein